MGRYFSCIIVGVLGLIPLQKTSAQATGDYRSNVLVIGNWSDATSWERFNGATWVVAATPPSSADGVITIVNGDRIDLILATTIDQVVIDAGGQLFIFNLATPFVCTLANGAGTDILNNGTLAVSLNATLSGLGTVVNNAIGTFIVRNSGTLAVSSTNDGSMEVSNTGTFSSTTVTNNATFTLIDFTLNLNTATFTNRGTVNLPSLGDTFIAGTGGGIFINETDGTIYKSSIFGIAWIDPALGNVTFTNRGVIKGIGEFTIRSTASNTGVVSPGNNNAGALQVSPAFVTGKAPVFNLEIVSNGALAGVTYDRVNFSNVDAATINITGSTLDVSDMASDAVTTVYTLFSSTSTIVGPFATVHLPPTLGNLTYNANSITVQKISSVARYTWNGGNSTWATSTNWLPFRITPAATDVLTFNTGTTVTLTGVPTESIGGLNITNNTTLNLQAATTSKTLTVGNGFMNNLNIDPGSSLHSLNNGGVVLNLTIANGSRAVIGGVADMQNGTFNVQDNVLTLHTTAIPLLRTAGQFTLGNNGAIEFGDVLHPSGPAMTLTNSIFLAPPSINRISVSRTNGAIFGNQDITVNQAVFIMGNLTTNASAHLRFSTTATDPIERTNSKIIGYADMLPRTVGTSALTFLGVSIAAGSNVGTVGIGRVTGPSGINTFNGFSSIAATWNLTATVEPSPARNITFSWFSDFDNNMNTSFLFQDYRFDTGPSWTPVGPLAVLGSTGNPRTTFATATVKLTGAWTVADQLNVLPIVLGKFTGKQEDNHVALHWKTLSELNSDFFEVQRRREGEEGFAVLGTINGHGTSKEVREYFFQDDEPGEGINYYRLRLVDFDQTFDYSAVVSVPFEILSDLLIYPNPAYTNEINFVLPEQQQASIRITDMQQRTVLLIHTKGENFILNRSDRNLAPGIYIVHYNGSKNHLMKKLIVR